MAVTVQEHLQPQAGALTSREAQARCAASMPVKPVLQGNYRLPSKHRSGHRSLAGAHCAARKLQPAQLVQEQTPSCTTPGQITSTAGAAAGTPCYAGKTQI